MPKKQGNSKKHKTTSLVFKLNNLPFLVLFTGFLGRLLVIYVVKENYWYDEIIVTQISTQSIKLLLDTIKAEPHPPGYYLLLKMITALDPIIVKLLTTTASFLISLLALLYARSKKIISHFNLSLGLAWFFASFSFFSISKDVKHDSITFPVFLLFIFLILCLIKEKKNFKAKEIVISHALVLFMLFFGYIYYLQSLVILLIVSIYYTKKRLPKYLLIFQIVTLAVYIKLFAFDQIVINVGRFSWFGENYNSLLISITQHLTGITIANFWTDFQLILFFGSITLVLFQKPKFVNLFLHNTLLLITILIIIVTYSVGLFSRVRYVSFLFLLLSVLAGWGIYSFKRKYKLLYYYFTALFIVYPLIHSYNAIRLSKIKNTTYSEEILASSDNNIGYLEDHPLAPYITKLSIKQHDKRLVPISITNPELFKDKNAIDRSILALDGYYKNTTTDDLKKLFKKQNINDYVYILKFQQRQSYYDPKRLVLQTLNDSCKKDYIKPLSYDSILFVFKDCVFD